MKRTFPTCLIILHCISSFSLGATDLTTYRLAMELLQEETPELAAVEFRRFAMDTAEEEALCGYLFASYAYLEAGSIPSASEMLDRAEGLGGSVTFASEIALLNAEAARGMNDMGSALYYYDLLSAESIPVDLQAFAHRRSAALELSQGNLSAARRQLETAPTDESLRLEALDAYVDGKDKSPLIGGLLGLIPGAGYWYSGEVANGFRSLLLNSLFIYGMVETADNDQWAAFGVITFFEITWYSGSIYGGIDAAHRHNRDRLDQTLERIEGGMGYRPDSEIVVPLFKLNIHF